MRGKTIGLTIVTILMVSAFGILPTSADAAEWSEPLVIGEQSDSHQYNPTIASNSLGW